MWWDDLENALHGRVRGSNGESYTTTVYFSAAGGRPLEFG
jgi:hypothetical protein